MFCRFYWVGVGIESCSGYSIILRRWRERGSGECLGVNWRRSEFLLGFME